MFKDQTIESGNNSTNIQSKEVTFVQNNSGISYSDAKDIAMNVFKSNFYDLGDRVESVINERAERILDDYLKKLVSINPEYIKNTEDPDIRYVIYEAQKNHARRNDENIENLLVEALVQRTISNQNLTKELTLNESLTIIPKLTSEQIDILSLIFLVRYGSYVHEVPISSFINNIKIAICDLDIAKKDIFFEHLKYAGCISISIGTIEFKRAIDGKFPQIKTTSELEETINSNIEMSNLKLLWDDSNLCHSTLTTVGIAIAISNIKAKTGLDLKLDTWLHD